MQATTFDGRTTSSITADQARVRPGDAPFVWIDVRTDGPHDPAAAELLAALGLTPVEVSLALRTNVAGAFGATARGVLAATWLGGPAIPPPEVHVGWTPQWLLSVRSAGDDEMARVHREMQVRGAALFAEPPQVLGAFLQFVLYGIDAQVTALAGAVDEVDASILTGPHPSQLTRLRQVRTTAQAWGLRLPRFADAVEAALVAAVELPGMDDAGAQQLKAYAAHLRDTIQRLHEVAGDLRNAVQDYQTEVGNTQGDRINQLTVVSILFLPVTFLTGYFGMNFQWLDDGIESLGSWLLLGVLLPVGIVLGSAVVLARRGYSLRLGRRRRPQPPDVPGPDPGLPATGAR